MKVLFMYASTLGGLIFNLYLFNQWGTYRIDGEWLVFSLIAWVVLSIWSLVLKYAEESREPGFDANEEGKRIYWMLKKCPECKKKLPSYNTRKCPYCTADL